MEGTRVGGEETVYAAKARRDSLDGEHAVIGWKSKANLSLNCMLQQPTALESRQESYSRPMSNRAGPTNLESRREFRRFFGQ